MHRFNVTVTPATGQHTPVVHAITAEDHADALQRLAVVIMKSPSGRFVPDRKLTKGGPERACQYGNFARGETVRAAVVVSVDREY